MSSSSICVSFPSSNDRIEARQLGNVLFSCKGYDRGRSFAHLGRESIENELLSKIKAVSKKV